MPAMRIAAALLLLCAAGALAQAPPPLVETLEVRVVNLDVVVTDRDGRRVTGLTRDDFEILERKRPQSITHFAEIRGEEPASETVASTPGAVSPAERRGSSVIFFIDASSIEPRRRRTVFDELRRFAGNIVQPGDRAMVAVWNSRLRVVQGFTTSAEAIRYALDEAEKQAAPLQTNDRKMVRERVQIEIEMAQADMQTWPEAYSKSVGHAQSYAEEVYARTRSILISASSLLSAFRGSDDKKAFVYVGDFLSAKAGGEIMQYVEEAFRPYRQQVPESDAGLTMRASRVVNWTEAMINSANASAAALYMIATSGLSSLGEIDPAERDSPREHAQSEETMRQETRRTFVTMAEETGGLAFLGGDARAMMRRIEDDFRSYYSIGFRPTAAADAKSRELTVRVKKPGYEVRTRRSYSMRSPEGEMADRVVANLYDDVPGGELAVRTEAIMPEEFDGDKIVVPVNVYVGGGRITLIPREAMLVGEVTVYVCAGTPAGGASKVLRHTERLTIPPADEARFRAGHLTFSFRVIVSRKGENTISAGALDTVSGAFGLSRALAR